MQVRLLDRGILAGLLALAMVTCLAVSDGAQQKPKTLYERLGGYDAIAAVTDDFIGRLVADKQITRFFTGASTDSKKRIRQLVVDQICAATGGPCIYIGRSMKASHEGLHHRERLAGFCRAPGRRSRQVQGATEREGRAL